MTAKEMFEELGYERSENKHFIEYLKLTYAENARVRFWLESEILFVENPLQNYSPCIIDMKLMNAINEQVVELGWNINDC